MGNTVGSLSEAQQHAAKTHVTASASDPVTTEARKGLRWQVSSHRGTNLWLPQHADPYSGSERVKI